MKVIVGLILMVTVNGLPGNYDYYNEQEYQEQYDYDDDILNDVDDDATIPSHRPTILSDSIVLTVDSGTTIRLPCLVDKLPEGIQILWSRDDAAGTVIAMGTHAVAEEYKDRASVVMDEAGSTLSIGIAKPGDAGLYKCSVAVRGDQPEVKHQVVVRVPPSIDCPASSLVEVEAGQTISLDCPASGSPPPNVTWARLGRKMPDGSENITSRTVIFSSASRKHEGLYQCTASNGQDREASIRVEVEVNYPPEIEISEVFVNTVQEQELVELVCTVQGRPTPEVEWRRGTHTITGSGRVELRVAGRRHSLVISQVEEEDFGEYSCRASNRLGEQEGRIELSGHAAPAEFKSAAEGRAEDSFLLEWTSLSYSTINSFRLEVAEEVSSTWKRYPVTKVVEEGAYHWAGKMYLSKLSPATQYKARVSAQNEMGWSKPSQTWRFATLGAVPSPSSVTRSGASSVPGLCLLLFLSAILLAI